MAGNFEKKIELKINFFGGGDIWSQILIQKHWYQKKPNMISDIRGGLSSRVQKIIW